MNWVKIGEKIFNEDEVVAIAKKSINQIGGYIVIFRGGNALDIESSADGAALDLWNRFEDKAQTTGESGVSVG